MCRHAAEVGSFAQAAWLLPNRKQLVQAKAAWWMEAFLLQPLLWPCKTKMTEVSDSFWQTFADTTGESNVEQWNQNKQDESTHFFKNSGIHSNQHSIVCHP